MILSVIPAFTELSPSGVFLVWADAETEGNDDGSSDDAASPPWGGGGEMNRSGRAHRQHWLQSNTQSQQESNGRRLRLINTASKH